MLMTREVLRQAMPRPVLTAYRVGRSIFNRWRYRGHKYYCNVCDSNLKAWIHGGQIENRNYVCPVCYSYGRHRLMALVIDREMARKELTQGQTLLHFAPEVGLQNWLKCHLPTYKYVTADLYSPDVDLHLDLQEIALPNDSVNVIILSHVLEHVDNDVRALKELYRILAPGGRLLIQVPLSGKYATIEDKLNDPESRLAKYGKTDHVRLFGDDLVNRIADAGFSVTIHRAHDDPYADRFSSMALDLPEDSNMLYDNESTTFECRKTG